MSGFQSDRRLSGFYSPGGWAFCPALFLRLVAKKAGHDVEVHYDHYQARFVPWYGPRKAKTRDARCLRSAASAVATGYKRDNFGDSVLRQLAQVTEQDLKRVD